MKADDRVIPYRNTGTLQYSTDIAVAVIVIVKSVGDLIGKLQCGRDDAVAVMIPRQSIAPAPS